MNYVNLRLQPQSSLDVLETLSHFFDHQRWIVLAGHGHLAFWENEQENLLEQTFSASIGISGMKLAVPTQPCFHIFPTRRTEEKEKKEDRTIQDKVVTTIAPSPSHAVHSTTTSSAPMNPLMVIRILLVTIPAFLILTGLYAECVEWWEWWWWQSDSGWSDPGWPDSILSLQPQALYLPTPPPLPSLPASALFASLFEHWTRIFYVMQFTLPAGPPPASISMSMSASPLVLAPPSMSSFQQWMSEWIDPATCIWMDQVKQQ